jgi:PAS domain S-box-containing protein
MKNAIRKTDSASPPDDELRRKAEEIAKKSSPSGDFKWSSENHSEDTIKDIRMLHELRVHQIELEMQNEELRRRQMELEDTRAKYFNLYDLAPVGYITVNEQGLIQEANLTAAKLLNVDRRAMVRQPISDFLFKEDQDIYYLHRKQLFEKGEPQAYELRMIKKDHMAFWVNMTATVALDADGASVCRIVISDITESKSQQEEKHGLEERLQRAEKIEALGVLAGGIAHDLNNDLGVIIGYAELLLLDIDESHSMENSLQDITSCARHAAAIVQDLLTLARKGIVDVNVLNLNTLILDYQKSPEFEKLFSNHASIQIKTDLEPDLLNISGSVIDLEKTLSNLISNASEAMPQGGALIIKTANHYLNKPIYGYYEVREGDYVILSVSDTGKGIQTTDIKHIFEPFYTKKIMGKGVAGLGLSLVWGTMKAHQGYIDVQSKDDKGTTFTLYFPVTKEAITPDALSVPMLEYMGKGESILIVDDVKGQREMASLMLTKLNYQVASVSSGEEAVEYLKTHKADILVLDMIMAPGIDGLDTYKSILETHPKQKAIIVSGFSETDRVYSAQALGAGAYVKKPYILEKLGMAVKQELERSIP